MTNLAQTILNQLGGNRFAAMTGAKNFINGGDYLQFDLGRGATNKANKCRVTLTSDDLYTVEFFKWNARKLDMVSVGQSEGIYNDMLRDTFTAHTGFYTSL